MRNRLIALTGDLEAAKDKLGTIKEFQFLRTDAERQQQIKDQTVIIMSLENDLGPVQERILNTQEKIDGWRIDLRELGSK